jgi:putative intracellular protease/amidase
MPGASTFRDCKVLEDMVQKHAQTGKLYAAICAAPAVALGTWGLLNGLKVILPSIFIFHVNGVGTIHSGDAHHNFCDRQHVILHSWINYLQM